VATADESVTANDLVKLSAAGLGDDILVALIESHEAVFRLTADDVLDLRKRGLSEKVILAMLQTAMRPKEKTAEVTTGEFRPLETQRVDDVPGEPPPPVVVNVTQQVEQRVEQPRPEPTRTVHVAYPVAVPVFVAPRRPEKRPEPVYWGFGGQRRPDTWRDPNRNK
jgi:hypothetical protein